MNREIRDLWVAKLRSGDVQQGSGSLHYVDTDGVERMCCLGVLSSLAHDAGVVERTREGATYYYGPEANECALLPTPVRVWAGINNSNPVIDPSPGFGGLAAVLNDGGMTFAEIADLIEQNL